jgi:hypothetical protein
VTLFVVSAIFEDTLKTLIINAKNEVSLLIFIQKKYNHNLILNLNLLLTDSKNSNNLKIRILFDNIFNLKLWLSKKPATLDIQYVKIDKILRPDMIIYIIDHQHLLFIELKKI